MRKKKLTSGGFIEGKSIVVDHWGNPRFHIDDISSILDAQLIDETIKLVEKYKRRITYLLPQILTKWDGYTYYPGFEKIKITFEYSTSEKKNYLANFVKEENKININVFKLLQDYEKYTRWISGTHDTVSDDGGGRKSTRSNVRQSRPDYLLRLVRRKLFHELQHAIQNAEKIELIPTQKEDVIRYTRKKYGKEELTPLEFEDFLSKEHNKSFASALYAEYKMIPTEKECFDVEEELLKAEREGKLESGGIIPILNKKFSFKDLFKK